MEEGEGKEVEDDLVLSPHSHETTTLHGRASGLSHGTQCDVRRLGRGTCTAAQAGSATAHSAMCRGPPKPLQVYAMSWDVLLPHALDMEAVTCVSYKCRQLALAAGL